MRVGGEKRHRVRVLGPHQHVADGAGLDDLPRVHDRHVIADVGDDTQVVRDQDDRHAARGDEPAQQREDLGLDRHIECRRRLVCDEEAGRAGECQSDRDALGHAARDLVRVAPQHPRHIDDPDVFEQLRSDALGRGRADAAQSLDGRTQLPRRS